MEGKEAIRAKTSEKAVTLLFTLPAVGTLFSFALHLPH